MSNLHRERRLLDIDGAGNLDSLRRIREEEQNRLEAVLSSSPIVELMEEINELHDRLIARTVKLAELELARQGHGAPPVPYAYMLFGSGGRSEQTLSSDQDSGIVYRNPASESEAAELTAYFRLLGAKIVELLVSLGYPPCEGNVIASNPEWCLPIGEWEKKLDGWFEEPSWENVRYLLIVADARQIAGDTALGAQWNKRFGRDMVGHPVIVRRMMENTLRHKALVGVFGQLLTERYGDMAGSLDIKYGGYIPLVNVFRLLAVQAGIRETSTVRRIRALEQAEILTAEEAAESSEAFALFLRLRLLAYVKDEDGMWVGTGKLPAAKITREWRTPLKKALKLCRRLQRQIEREMRYRFGGR